MIFGLSVVSSQQLVTELGDASHGVVLAQVVPSPFRINCPIVKAYRKLAKAADLPYSYTSLEGYIAARTFTEGLIRAGKEPTRERLISALDGLNQWDAGGIEVDFSPADHVGLDFVDLSVISHGRFSQ
jgi:ABC-type branched-subunit amino acid transport system substrate-binding protein